MNTIRAPGTLPPGRRIYAVGDIHGCLAQLNVLHQAIRHDLAQRPVEQPLLVHVGDYVDKGEDSAGVVARLAQGEPVPGVPMVNLMGNHERNMLEALDGERAAATDWLHTGGKAALRSWGIDPDSRRTSWRERLPEAHLAFLRGLGLTHREGDYLFVHAGIRPGVALEAQKAEDLLCIRAPFLESEADLGLVVVHGHTPKQAPVVRPNRIGIDTGAVYGRQLTCAVLEEDQLAFLQS